jgi:hypothetical protein
MEEILGFDHTGHFIKLKENAIKVYYQTNVTGSHEVEGSNPFSSTIKFNKLQLSDILNNF